MKTLLKLLVVAAMIAVCVPAAVAKSPKFSNLKQSDDPTYGYTPQNAIPMHQKDVVASMGIAHSFVSALRTEEGAKLEYVTRNRVKNPNYEQGNPKTGTPYLDEFVLRPEGGDQTIRLYINPDAKGALRVPVRLTVAK